MEEKKKIVETDLPLEGLDEFEEALQKINQEWEEATGQKGIIGKIIIERPNGTD